MKRALLLGLLLVAIAACSGGGGGTAGLPPPGHGGTIPAQATKESIRVTFPSASTSGSGVHRPAFLTPNTASFSLVLYTVNGATPNPQPTPLAIQLTNSQYCSSSGGSTTCTVAFNVPVAAAVVVEIQTFDASGNLIGGGFVGPIDTTQATIPTQNITVGGVLATMAFGAAALSAGSDGAQHTVTFTVTGKDKDGNTILPPGNYPVPITFAITGDPNVSLSVSPASIASPGPNGSTTVSVTYNSAKALTSLATITGSSGTAGASLTFAPIIFTPTSLPSLLTGGLNASVTVSEPGYAGAFTPTETGSVATVSCVPANCTPASAGASVTVNVAPGTAGNEVVSIADSHGFASLPITVTSSTGGGRLVGPPYTINEFTTSTGGRNYGIAVGPDGGTLWFVDRGNVELGAVPNPASCGAACAITETPLGLPTTPPFLQSITAAPDGNLYVTDVGNGSSDLGGIEQETCSSVPSVTCASGNMVPSFGYLATPAPAAIIAAPDGNLYATSQYSDPFTNGNMLVASSAGCCSSGFSPFAIGDVSSSLPNMLTVDQTGSMIWFSDTGNGDIGFFPIPCNFCVVSIEPEHTFFGGGARRRPPPGTVHVSAPRKKRSICCGSPFATPLNGIIAAPDGNLYLAEGGANEIDQLNPNTWEGCSGANCSFTPIALPNATGVPQNLVVGPDGNVWFTDSTGYVGFVSLASCATTCKAYEYHVGGSPWGIAKGPDGNIWFTDSSTNKIGEVVLQ